MAVTYFFSDSWLPRSEYGGPGGSALSFTVPFTFATPSGAIGAIGAGTTMVRVAVLIETPFDDPNATIALGLAGGSASAFLLSADSLLAQAGQYETEAMVPCPVPDMLTLTMTPGTSTQGAGTLFYEFAP